MLKFVPFAAMRTFHNMLSVAPFDVTNGRGFSAVFINACEFLCVRNLSSNRVGISISDSLPESSMRLVNP